ncbi:hypothetical protein GGS26DRAFT_559096 [Hypomontagnella submonticulosa]|nr:hypothetical protein GGS26DRAFT_559096 [Hypomontagnella submonticulosa]
MGARASKPAQSATRKFPTRAPGSSAPPHTQQRPSTQPRTNPQASFAKDDTVKAENIDPDPNPLTNAAFSQRLKQMGVATPNPTLSNSLTAFPYASSSEHGPAPQAPNFPPASQNRTLSALEARQRLQERAQLEFENMAQGKEFIDIGTLKQMLALQARGTPASDIEKRFKLKSGVVARLGPKGVTLPLGG